MSVTPLSWCSAKLVNCCKASVVFLCYLAVSCFCVCSPPAAGWLNFHHGAGIPVPGAGLQTPVWANHGGEYCCLCSRELFLFYLLPNKTGDSGHGCYCLVGSYISQVELRCIFRIKPLWLWLLLTFGIFLNIWVFRKHFKKVKYKMCGRPGAVCLLLEILSPATAAVMSDWTEHTWCGGWKRNLQIVHMLRKLLTKLS